VEVGLSVYDIAGAELIDLARAAEAAGFSTLWLGEHIVLPVAYEAEHPATGGGAAANSSHLTRIVDPDTKLLDPLVALAAVAAVTDRIRLATGIYLVGLRHPLAVARMTLTLQDVARGRFMLGVGSGWLEEEFAGSAFPSTSAGRATRRRSPCSVSPGTAVRSPSPGGTSSSSTSW